MALLTGIGLRPPHYEKVLRGESKMQWFEVISENFIDSGGRPLWILEQVRRDYSIGMHGVSLNVGSSDSLNKNYLKKLNELIKKIDPMIVSDHLCWGGVKGRNWHDLLPLPMTQKFVKHISDRILRVQDVLGRRIALENISTYVRFKEDEMAEWDFVTEIAQRSDSFILLDINNIYVNSFNHNFNAKDFIDYIPQERVVQYHLAGHSDLQDFLFDTHDQDVGEPVWELLKYASQKIGPRPFVIERDDNIPELSFLETEALQAAAIQKSFISERSDSEPTEVSKNRLSTHSI